MSRVDLTQIFKEADLKQWLTKRAGYWDLIQPINFSLRMNHTIAYAQGRDNIKPLVDQRRKESALEEAML